MSMERTASLSMIDATQITIAPGRRRPAPSQSFAPIKDYETNLFAALKAREEAAPNPDQIADRKSRLPRFSLLRGEVALLAERCWPKGRTSA